MLNKERTDLKQIAGWLCADGVFSERVTDAEMADYIRHLTVMLAMRINGRAELATIQRQRHHENLHDAAEMLRQERDSIARNMEQRRRVSDESFSHRYEPIRPSIPLHALDLGDDGMEVARG